jgi:hypothetical protein
VNPFITAWLVIAVLTLATDLTMVGRRLSGKLGLAARDRYRNSVQKVGGMWVSVPLNVAFDLLLWPLAIVGLAFAYHHDWRPTKPRCALGPSCPREVTSNDA